MRARPHRGYTPASPAAAAGIADDSRQITALEAAELR